MRTIHKFPIPMEGRQVFGLYLPSTAKVLCVGVQQEQPFMWVDLDTNEACITWEFVLNTTGNALHERSGDYIGTVQLYGGMLVLHVYHYIRPDYVG